MRSLSFVRAVQTLLRDENVRATQFARRVDTDSVVWERVLQAMNERAIAVCVSVCAECNPTRNNSWVDSAAAIGDFFVPFEDSKSRDSTHALNTNIANPLWLAWWDTFEHCIPATVHSAIGTNESRVVRDAL